MRTRILGTLVAALLGAAAGVTAFAAPAQAAACPKGTGVSVVVNSSVGCDANGVGKYAIDNFDALHSLTFVQNQPGFVCQIDGYPATSCADTPPASAYWSLWWSDGVTGWKYSNRGAGSLKAPAGGFVGFVFGNGKSAPGVAPVGTSPPSKPSTSKPKPSTSKPTAKPSASASASASATPTPTDSATPSASASASSSASAKAGDDTTNTSATADSDEGSGPLVWVAAGLAGLLVAGMGFAVWRRRMAGQS